MRSGGDGLILIPAALEGQVTRQRAEALACSAGAGRAWRPGTYRMLMMFWPPCEAILVVPDVVCNAGVTVRFTSNGYKDMASAGAKKRSTRAWTKCHDRRDRPMSGRKRLKSCSLRTAAILSPVSAFCWP